MEIKDFSTYRAKVEEILGFLLKVNIETECLTLESDAAMKATYAAAVLDFEKVYKQNTINSQTVSVQDADKEADYAHITARAYFKAMVNHPEEEVAAAAKIISAMFEKYGSINRKAYSEEYAAMGSLIVELDTVSADTLSTVAGQMWIERLKTGYNAFNTAQTAQREEEKDYVVGVVKEKRTAAEEAYYTLVKRVNALALINGEEPYANFIKGVTLLIDNENANIAARETRAKTKKEKEEAEKKAAEEAEAEEANQ